MQSKSLLMLLIIAIALCGCNTKSLISEGNRYLILEDFPKSIRLYSESIHLDSSKPEPFLFRGIAKFKSDDTFGAFQDFTQVVKLDSLNPYGYFLIGEYYGSQMTEPWMTRVPNQMEYYNKAIQLDSTNSIFFIRRGQFKLLEFEDDSLLSALKDFDKAIQCDPRTPAGYMSRSRVKEKLGDSAGALDDLKKSAELGSPYAKALIHVQSMDIENDLK